MAEKKSIKKESEPASAADCLRVVGVGVRPDGTTLYSLAPTQDVVFDRGKVLAAGERYMLSVADDGTASVTQFGSMDIQGDDGIARFGGKALGQVDPQNPVLPRKVREIIASIPAVLDEDEDDESDEEPEKLQLVTYKISHNEVSHAFASKSLRGLHAIATDTDGASGGVFRIESGSSTSKDAVILTAVPARCKEFFEHGGANHYYIMRLLGVIHSLITDERAVKDASYGRVWVTEAKMLTEMSRTEQGAVSVKTSRNASSFSLLHTAMLMLTSSSTEITLPNGSTLATEKMVDAVFRASVVSGGKVMANAWGFVPEIAPLFANELSHYVGYYAFLSLPPSVKEEDMAIPVMVQEWIHELRGKLYPAGRKPHKSSKVVKQFDKIFDDIAPGCKLRSEKKKVIATKLVSVLAACAEKECGPDRASGDRPIWIQAQITRDPSRGRGKGSWVSIEVVAYSDETDIKIPSVD